MKTSKNTIVNFPVWVLEKWQDIADILAGTIGIPAVLIMKTENESMEVFISSHSENNPYSVGTKEKWHGLYCETVIKTQNKLLVPDATKDKVWDKNPDIKLGMIAYLGFPLNFPDNQPFGTLCVLDNKERPFTLQNEKLIQQFKNVIELDLALLQSFDLQTANVVQKIAERKQKEENLRHSQDFMNSIIEKIPSSLWISDEHGTLIRMNQACRDILSLQDEEVVGKYNIFNDNIIKEQGFMPLVRDVYEKGATVRFIISYDTAAIKSLTLGKTKRVDLDVSISPNIDPQGKVINAIIQHIDITERMRADESLKESEEKFRNVFEAANVGKSITSTNGKIHINNAFCEMLGYTKEELQNKSWQDITPSDEIEIIQKEINRLLNGELNSTRFNKRYIHKNGSYIWTDVSVAIQRDNQGIPLHFITTVNNISERKRAEEALQISEQKYRNIFDNAPLGIFQTTPEGKFLRANAALANMMGYSSPEEMIRLVTNIADQHYVEPPTRNKEKNTAMKEGRFILSENMYRRVNGTTWVGRAFSRIIHDELGTPMYYEGFVEDITERKQAESILQDIIDKNPMSIQIVDAEGLTLKVNPAHTELFGAVPPPGFSIFNDLQRRSPELEKLILLAKSGEVVHFPDYYYNVHDFSPEFPDRPLWIHAILFPLKESTGEFDRLVFMHENITRRKQAEEAIKVNEQKFRNILESSPFQIWAFDGKIYTYVNKSYVDFTGIDTNKTLTPDIWTNYIHPDDLEAAGKTWIKAWENKAEHDNYFRLRNKNGQYHDFWCHAVPIYDENGNFRQFQGFNIDITERKQFEEKLKSSESRAHATINSSPVPMAINNEQLQITFLNPAFTQLYGYTITDIPTLNDWWTKAYPDPEYRQKANDIWATEMARIKKTGLPFKPMEFSIRCKNGTDRTAFISATSFSPLLENEHLILFQDITEYKLAEEKIRAKDIQFRKLSANLPDLIYQFTRRPDGTYYVPIASEGIRNIFGCSPEDVLNDFTPIGKVIYPDDAARVIADIEYSAKNLTYFTCEFRVQIPGKEIQWILSRSTPEKLPDGSITWYGFNADITERKLAEEKIHEKDIQFRKLSAQLPDLIFQFTRRPDGSYYVPIASEGIRNIFGCSPEDVLNDFTPIGKVIYPDDAARVIADIEYSAKNLTYFTCEFRVQIPGKEIQWILSRSTPEKLPDGSITWYGFNADITERKRAEEELYHLSARLSLAVRVGGVGVWDYDIVHDTLLWDDQMFTLYGINKNDFGGVYQAWRSGLHPEDVAWVDVEIQMAIDGDKEFDTRFRVVWPDGSIHIIRALGSIQRNVDGQAVRMIGTNWDITEQKKAEQELIFAKEKAEESDRLKSAFLANMSHEIRTPMNGILGFSELLKEPRLTGDKQQEYIRIIEKSGARMLNIINNIVDISRIEAGLMNLKIKESNINEQIEYIYTFFQPEMVAKSIKFSFKNTLPAKEAIINTDSEKLFAILINLVKNAVKYTDKGSIEFGYYKKGDNLEFYVRDTGIGVPKGRQKAIFERFIQADIADKQAYQGAGLGLSISKAYVEMLGGKIWVESEDDSGSTFYFTLPYINEPIEKIESKNTVPADSADIYANKLKILIVEDDETSEKFLSIAVIELSKSVIIAQTGIEAIEVLNQNPDIDLILMDILMPDMNGLEATRQIRKFNKDVIIIAQTAYGLAGDREKAIEAGCNDYVSKPVKKDELRGIIQKYFKK